MNRLLFRLLPVLLVVLAIGIPVSSVLADECSEEDCIFWVNNFSADADWDQLVLLDTNLNPTDFFDPVRNYNSTGNYLYSIGYGHTPYDSLGVKYVFDSTCSITDLTVGTYNPPGSQPARMAIGLKIGGSWSVFENRLELAGAGSWAFTIDTADVEEIGIQFTSPQPEIQGVKIEGMCEGTDPGPGGLMFPLKGEDANEDWDNYDNAYVHSIDETWPDDEGHEPVYSYSNKLGASVHAIEGGTVTAVDLDITSQCNTLDQTPVPFAPHACWILLPSAISGEAFSQIFTVSMTATALVLIKSDDDPLTVYTYFVSKPTVAVGDVVEGGCIIGEVMALNNAPAHVGDIDLGASLGNDGVGGSVGVSGGLNSIQTGTGVVVVRRTNFDIEAPGVQRLLPDLGQEPDESACGGSFSGCVNANSSLLTLNDWVVSDGVDLLDGGGVSLPGGSTSSQIYQTGLVLEDATDYTLTVQARSTTPGNGFDVVNRIRLFAGTNIQEDGITTSWLNYSLDFIGEDLSADQAFGVVNQNYIGTDIEIRYICISEAGSGNITNACYFKNHHFDDGPTGWTVAGGASFQSGQAFTYNGSTVEQGATLYPVSDSEAATYNLTVGGRLIATSAYTGQSGKHVALYYRFPMTGDYELIEDVDASVVAAEGVNVYSGGVDIEHFYSLTTEIEISAYTNSLFSIQTIVEDSDNYLRGFRIDYICLQATTVDGGFPGQPGTGFDPPFYENCEVINTPQDNNISSWTYYHWQNLRRFFDCTLMVRLNKMAEAMDSVFKTARLFMRWIVATGQLGGRWMSTQLMPWLNGQFRNIAIGRVTTVYESGGGSCSDFFCVLNNLITGILAPVTNVINTLLGILTTVADLFLTILTGVISLGLAFLGRLFGIFNQATGLLSGLINAYSTATPITIEGMPMCTVDPESSMFCRMVWVMDNTAFKGRWGILFAVALSILTIHLIIWAIGEFRRAILASGAATA